MLRRAPQTEFYRLSSSMLYMCKFYVQGSAKQRNNAFSVHSLYAYHIWIGIRSHINDFTTAYAMNIVGAGRSRILPITVVGLRAASTYCFIHYV